MCLNIDFIVLPDEVFVIGAWSKVLINPFLYMSGTKLSKIVNMPLTAALR